MSKHARRITPDDVRAALKAHPEIVLRTGRMKMDIDGVPQCCAMGAVFFRTHADEIWDVCHDTLGFDYTSGFWHGFDDRSMICLSERTQQGYEDGLRCRQELLTL